MEFLRRNLAQIQSQFGAMSFATRWLVVSLVVIMLLVGGMLIWWGGSADMVPVDGLASGSATEAMTTLQADGIEAEIENGALVVPRDQLHEAVAALSRAGRLDPNAHAEFDKLLTSDTGSWTQSSTEKDRRYLAAKGQFLSAVILSFPNVETASVIIDKPEHTGFGPSHVDPSASVMVTMRPGSSVSRQMADTLIHMVGSAVAGLSEQNVTVSDTNRSRVFTAADDDQIDNLANHEATQVSERLHKKKIEDVLGWLQGVRVGVQVVTSQVQREDLRELEHDKPAIASTETEEIIEKNSSRGGEPGAGANIRSTIETGGGTGRERTENRAVESFGSPMLKSESVKRIAGNTIRQINVSVVVPRSYYVRVFKAQKPDADEPTDADLQPIVAMEESKIRDLVGRLTVSSEKEIKPGEISVAMAYDKAYLEPAQAGVGGGLGAVMESQWAEKGVLASLAVMTLGLMFYMVRRATRKEDLPAIEELAGVPPTLPTDDDLVGEVEQVDAGLAGVELDEEELRARQIADQISDLVRANPEEAGGLLTKWVVDDER